MYVNTKTRLMCDLMGPKLRLLFEGGFYSSAAFIQNFTVFQLCLVEQKQTELSLTVKEERRTSGIVAAVYKTSKDCSRLVMYDQCLCSVQNHKERDPRPARGLSRTVQLVGVVKYYSLVSSGVQQSHVNCTQSVQNGLCTYRYAYAHGQCIPVLGDKKTKSESQPVNFDSQTAMRTRINRSLLGHYHEVILSAQQQTLIM